MSDTAVWEEEETEQMPPRRRRRRLVTPVTGVLFAVLLCALGFIAGALVERGKADPGTSAGPARAGFAQRAAAPGGLGRGGATAGGGGAAPSGGSGAVVGQVANLKGRTLYLTDTQGNTVKVRVPKGATVTKTSTAGFGAINPGDSLVIQGARAKNGTVTAASIQATASSVGASGALSALFGGGRAGGTP